jgi:hypothetical protein
MGSMIAIAVIIVAVVAALVIIQRHRAAAEARRVLLEVARYMEPILDSLRANKDPDPAEIKRGQPTQ